MIAPAMWQKTGLRLSRTLSIKQTGSAVLILLSLICGIRCLYASLGQTTSRQEYRSHLRQALAAGNTSRVEQLLECQRGEALRFIESLTGFGGGEELTPRNRQRTGGLDGRQNSGGRVCGTLWR